MSELRRQKQESFFSRRPIFVYTTVVMIGLCLFGGGIALGWWRGTAESSAQTGHPIRLPDNRYKLINPLLAYEISDNKNFLEFQPLKKALESLVQREKTSGNASDVGIYFRDLSSGKWTGVNENGKFSPASLLKVPLLITYLKAGESDPAILTRRITYDGSFDDNVKENIPPASSVAVGHSYTIEELLRFMIAYSDNNATHLLFNGIDTHALQDVFSDLRAPFPQPGELGDYMSPKSYAFFYRVLYGSTYLTRAMSEKALDLLTTPDFTDGLVAGVPTHTTVAQKFGEHSFEGVPDTESKQLHDCGIVYHPEHPYLLCVMTKGSDFQRLSKVIKEVSETVYAAADSDYK